MLRSSLPVLFPWLPAILTLLLSGNVAAQSEGVWSSISKTSAGVKKAAGKKVSAIRKWKDHLQQWGLDSNYNHSLSLGGRLNSDGWSGMATYKRLKSRSSYNLYQLSFSEIRQEKEASQQKANTAFPELGASSSFIYGKLNNLYTLRLGFGKEQLLLPGIVEGNISVGLRYAGGFSLAMLKPYYLRLIYVDNSTQPATAHESDERYSAANSSLFLDPSFILGRYKWSKGLGEITYIPGIYGQTALVIEPAKGKTLIQTITLGISGAVYSQKLVIMADQKAYRWEGCLFAGLELGKRWK